MSFLPLFCPPRISAGKPTAGSCLASKVFGARRILLMTPVDDQLKRLYQDYLAAFDIEALYPPQTLRAHTDAQKLTSEDVAAMTRETFAAPPNVDAIYFQGALSGCVMGGEKP
jgi:maleate cis-trans isomerase